MKNLLTFPFSHPCWFLPWIFSLFILWNSSRQKFRCDLSISEITMKTNQQTENILLNRKRTGTTVFMCVMVIHVGNKQIHSEDESFFSVLGFSPRFSSFNFAVPCPCPPPLFNFSPFPCVIARAHFSPQLWSVSPWELWVLS